MNSLFDLYSDLKSYNFGDELQVIQNLTEKRFDIKSLFDHLGINLIVLIGCNSHYKDLINWLTNCGIDASFINIDTLLARPNDYMNLSPDLVVLLSKQKYTNNNKELERIFSTSTFVSTIELTDELLLNCLVNNNTD